MMVENKHPNQDQLENLRVRSFRIVTFVLGLSVVACIIRAIVVSLRLPQN